jgi:hypothetical protein
MKMKKINFKWKHNNKQDCVFIITNKPTLKIKNEQKKTRGGFERKMTRKRPVCLKSALKIPNPECHCRLCKERKQEEGLKENGRRKKP